MVSYNLFLSTTHLHANRAYLVIVLAALAVVPCGRELSVDAWLRARRGLPALDPRSPAWPLWLLRFEASVVYGASGLSKLVDGDWFGGTVTWHRMVQVRDHLDASPLPGWAVSLLVDRSVHTVAAKVIVLTELFIAAGLWWRATRYAAVWAAVAFHIAIQLSASVEVFSYLAIAALGHLGRAIHPRPDGLLRPHCRGPPPAEGGGGGARLVGPLPVGGGRPRLAPHPHRPRRHGVDRPRRGRARC